MDVFLARQPIFKPNKKIFGYELLFRMGLENVFPDIDGDTATSSLLSNIFSPFNVEEILGKKVGLINFTEKLILQRMPMLLPRKHFIIEVLEDIEPGEALISELASLKEKGFRIALDDFVFHKKYRPMMELSNIIKFDLMATPLDSIADIVKEVHHHYDITLLAEKIETHQEFEQAKEMGFELFQGFFFSKPELLSSKGISAGQVTKLRLVNELGRQELNLEKIEDLIKKDVSISFKLLKFINSAYFNRRNPVDTVKEAIIYLGIDELRKFINMVVLSNLSTRKPNELVRLSIIRARMCEQCGLILNTVFTSDELFTLGLFSFMDAILDCKMEDVLKYLMFSPKMEMALLGKNKEFNIILSIVKSFEEGDWKSLFFKTISGKAIETKFPTFYCDSVKMANSFFG